MRKPQKNWCRFTAVAVLAVGIGLSASDARALEVRTVIWGFDGKVVPNQFNPLSILLDNPSPDPFNGLIELQRTLPDGPKGALLVEPVSISPFTRRWVQFYPFIQREWEEWTLSWKPGGRSFKLPRRPPHGPPAHILLDSPGSLGPGGTNLRVFNEEIFPPIVAATAPLATVTLDHKPRWLQARQEAFLDWLRAGGRLHLLHDSGGEYPNFTGLLTELNKPLERYRVGSGVVFRHPRKRNQLDGAFVRDQIHAVRRTVNPQNATNGPGEQPPAQMDIQQTDQWGNSTQINFSELNHQFFREMKGMTKADHNWILIHLMSIVYILFVFPGGWLVGLKWRDYRITLGALLGAILLFSVAFNTVGRRGYGESTAVHSIAVARPLAGAEYEVTMWTNVFVTDGDEYTISHAGVGRLYSTCQEQERVKGMILNGMNGQFLVDIPPYSSREFVAQFKAPAKPIKLDVVTWEKTADGLNLSIKTGPNFPDDAVDEMYALYGDAFYSVSREGDVLTLASHATKAAQFLAYNQLGGYRNYGPFNSDDRTPEQVFRGTLEPLIARSLGINSKAEISTFSLPEDRVRLFVFAPLPEEFYTLRTVNEKKQVFNKRQEGRVLYCLDVFDPEEP